MISLAMQVLIVFGGGQGFSNMDVNDIFSAFGDIFGDSDNIFGSMFGNQGRSRRRKAGAI